MSKSKTKATKVKVEAPEIAVETKKIFVTFEVETDILNLKRSNLPAFADSLVDSFSLDEEHGTVSKMVVKSEGSEKAVISKKL